MPARRTSRPTPRRRPVRRPGAAPGGRVIAIAGALVLAVAGAVVLVLTIRPGDPDAPPATPAATTAAPAPRGASEPRSTLPRAPEPEPLPVMEGPAEAPAAVAPDPPAGHPPAEGDGLRILTPGDLGGVPGAAAAAAAPAEPRPVAAPLARAGLGDDAQHHPFPALGWQLTLPDGWTAALDRGSEIVEVARDGARFFVEPVESDDDALRDLTAATAMVESFREDGLTVAVQDSGAVADGFYVSATAVDARGRVEPHLFVVRAVAGRKVVCRLGPGVVPEDVPQVRAICESIGPIAGE